MDVVLDIETQSKRMTRVVLPCIHFTHCKACTLSALSYSIISCVCPRNIKVVSFLPDSSVVVTAPQMCAVCLLRLGGSAVGMKWMKPPELGFRGMDLGYGWFSGNGISTSSCSGFSWAGASSLVGILISPFCSNDCCALEQRPSLMRNRWKSEGLQGSRESSTCLC